MNETEIERMVVRLLGDGTLYTKMCEDAVKSTNNAAKSISISGQIIEKTQKTLEGFGRALTRVGQGIRSIGTLASVGITAPVTALAGVATNEFNQFESALSRMKGLVGLSDETILQFREHILSLAKDTGKAPVELARAMENITSSGIQGAAALETLNITSRAAAGGLGEVRSVSDTVTSAMNAYGVANLSATKATDILVAAVREGKAEADTFAPVLGNVLPIANEMGISFDEAAGSIAYLTLATGSAATAATQYQNILAQTLKLNPEKEAGKNLTKLGIDVKAFQNAVGDEGLLPSLMKLKEQLAASGKSLKDAFPDVQAMTAALQLTGANSEKAASVLANVADAAGSVDKAFNAAAETTQFKLNQAMAEMKTILIELGEIVAPIFAKFTAGLGSMMQFWKTLTPKSKEWVVTLLAAAAAMGPLLVAFGTLVAFAGSVVSGLAAMVSVAPAVLTGIALIGGAIVDIARYRNLFPELADGTKLWGTAVNWLGQQWQALMTHLTPAIEGIKNAFTAGDLELAVQIFWSQVKLSFAVGRVEIIKIWNDLKYDLTRVWLDITGTMQIEFNKAILGMQIKQREFIEFMMGGDGKLSNKVMEGFLKAQSDFAEGIQDARQKALGGVREANTKNLLGSDKEIKKLTDERDKLTKVADYLANKKQFADFAGGGVGNLSNDPAIKEVESALKDLDDKAKIKISLEFDAAGKGSAEAINRINSYQQALGLSPTGGFKMPSKKNSDAEMWAALTAQGNLNNAALKPAVRGGGFKNVPNESADVQMGRENWLEFKAIFERIAKGVEKEPDGLIMIEPANFGGA